MIVLSKQYPGMTLICEECGCLMADIQKSDIYGANLVYCPLCKHANEILYDRNYEGVIKENDA